MTTYPVAAPNVIIEELDADVCLYRPDTDEVLVLNQTAGDIWRLADGEHSVPGIAATLATAYSQPAGEVEDAVRTTVNDLVDRGFLIDSPNGSSPLPTNL